MKKLVLIFLIPIFSFTQSGDTNGDGFVNLEDLFNVLENWLQEVNANDPESISNIDEMINVVDSLITINRNFDISKNTYFPEGLSSQIINHNFSQGEYVVPEGKRLYILNVQCDGGLFIDNLEIMYNVQSGQSNTLGLPIIINANQTVNIIQANGSFNGFLVDESSNFEGVTIQVEPNTYTVPNNKILFINHYYSGNLAIDNNAVWGSNTTTARYTLRLPTMVSAGQEVSCTTIGNFEGCVINGYLVSEDYFSSVSNNNSSNNQSNSNNNSSVTILDLEYGETSDCSYINNLNYGSIIHNPLSGTSSIVVPGIQCGSTDINLIESNQWNYTLPAADYLLCFSVNDSIVMTSLPYYNGQSNLYFLENVMEGYDPNIDSMENNDQFTSGQVNFLLSQAGSIGIVLIPNKIYGWRLNVSGNNVVQASQGINIIDSEIFNHLGIWMHDGISWQESPYFPLFSNFYYYPVGKSLKNL